MNLRAICGLILAAALAIPSSAAAEKLKPFTLKTVDGVEKTLADVLEIGRAHV